MALLQFTDNGLYCAAGDFYIDPWKPVNKAVITHAHSDHARAGSQAYLCHTLTKPLLELRLGPHAYQQVEWDEPVYINGVRVSLHPAGHVIGSSQIRLEKDGEIWVVSGDYKTEDDGLSGAFDPVQCHTFITESTFGLPIYNWQPQAVQYAQIGEWIVQNQQQGYTSVLLAYSLGKAQRVLQAAATVSDNIYLHGAVANTNDVLANAGIALPFAKRVTSGIAKDELKKAVVIAPSSALDSSWLKRFTPYRVAVCSGWMQVRGNKRRQHADAGFAVSDHADWNGLLQAVKATGAEQVYVTHGFQSVFSRYLQDNGIQAAEVVTQYGEAFETDDVPASTQEQQP